MRTRGPHIALAVLMAISAGGPIGCQERQQAPAAPDEGASVAGKKILMVIAPQDFRDEELFKPRQYFMDRGAQVTVASSAGGQIRGMLGGTYTPEAKLPDVRAADFDAVIFVGGVGAKAYFDDPLAHKLAREAAESQKVVGAICIAPAILAKAGLLNGRQATVSPSARETLKAGGAEATDKHCIRDGRIITADGPAAAQEFAAAVAKALAE